MAPLVVTQSRTAEQGPACTARFLRADHCGQGPGSEVPTPMTWGAPVWLPLPQARPTGMANPEGSAHPPSACPAPTPAGVAAPSRKPSVYMASMGLTAPSHRAVPDPGCTGHSVPPLGNRGHQGQAETQVRDWSG